MKATLVLSTALLSGCIPATSLIDSHGLLDQMRGEIRAAKKPTATQALDALCAASYRDVIATLGEKAPEVCG